MRKLSNCVDLNATMIFIYVYIIFDMNYNIQPEHINYYKTNDAILASNIVFWLVLDSCFEWAGSARVI